ncbi:MAG: hypothetical protein OMM_05868 [Candidatus Magnetoglobus multicellularis str. Araruama]|uniref:Uncharacterized protein n=1 Tax=Candidatus Magnetoglobus multicellularis str. Araruama TaxID=890399 RepID=A0A1V1NTM3_9BACT|nr:MAG: hypothetical protein OMM_05868 [Candidatus Magnetoglobus multicellularis str. Araruama]
MDERLAVVVSKIDELPEIFRQYQQNSPNETIAFTGNAKNKSSSELIIDEEEGKQFIDNLIQKRKLNKIGMFWVSGIEIDWQLLYDTPPKRIALPTYPFEKKRYWIQKDQTRPASKSVQAFPIDEPPQLLYLETKWIEKPIEPGKNPIDNQILVFCNHSDRFDKMRSNVVTVHSGENFEQLSETKYCICPDNASDYPKLIENLDHIPEFIIHLWSDHPFEPDNKIVRNDISKSLISLFYLTQALLNKKRSNNIRIIYAYPSNQPLYEAISGFARTLSQENSDIQLKTVGFKNPYEMTAHILSECFVNDGLEIQYDDKIRQVKQLQPFEPSSISELSLKENGVYLITGGSGKLGQTIAKYIAEKVQSTIVLCGRKNP